MKFIPIEDFGKPCKAPRSRKEILKDLNSKEKELIQKIHEEGQLLKSESGVKVRKPVRGLTQDIIIIDEIMIEEPLPEPDVEPRKKKTKGPDMLSCGHNNWFSAAELKEATDKGLCCPSGSKEMGRYKVPYWPSVTTHIPIIPPGQRRTKENSWYGFCSDTDGKYIGGKQNDCSAIITDKTKRCAAHRSEVKLSTAIKDANKNT